jgi:hypothetical protein
VNQDLRRQDKELLKITWHAFAEHPVSDCCWSLSTGPDGRIYAASCCELLPGETAKIVRYHEPTETLEYLFDLDKAVEDPCDSGRGTQCKIHYSFAPSLSDGIMYMATHLSAAPIDLPSYSPWNFWHDPERCFRGSALIAFDTKTDRVRDWETLFPKEGCRCLLHDEERGLLYAISYPRDHLFVWDLKKRRARDLGRISSVNPQALFLDARHRVWTSNDDGRLVRYDPERDRIEVSPYLLPHNPAYQNGWHSVLYDAVASPDGRCIYAVTWIAEPRLVRIWPDEGEWGRVEDLGAATQGRDLTLPICTFLDHCGGLTFGGDGQLYYVASRWLDPVHQPNLPDPMQGVVWRLDPSTLKKTEVALLPPTRISPQAPENVLALKRSHDFSQYVSRGAVDRHGNLFFGNVGARPSGLFKLHMPAKRQRKDSHLPLRMWG